MTILMIIIRIKIDKCPHIRKIKNKYRTLYILILKYKENLSQKIREKIDTPKYKSEAITHYFFRNRYIIRNGERASLPMSRIVFFRYGRIKT